MANSYTQIYIHYVFVVKGRNNFLLPKHNDELQKYITGLVQNRKSKMIQVNNVSDHLHMVVGQHPTWSVSKFAQEVKSISSGFINDKKWLQVHFNWQSGYGAFSVSHSQLGKVINYIKRQQIHHKKVTFRKEYLDFLEKYEIEFEKEYVFEFYD